MLAIYTFWVCINLFPIMLAMVLPLEWAGLECLDCFDYLEYLDRWEPWLFLSQKSAEALMMSSWEIRALLSSKLCWKRLFDYLWFWLKFIRWFLTGFCEAGFLALVALAGPMPSPVLSPVCPCITWPCIAWHAAKVPPATAAKFEELCLSPDFLAWLPPTCYLLPINEFIW